MDELVAIARIARPHGLRGEVSADVLTDFPERFDGLENVIAVLPGGERRELRIERFRFQNERVLLKFSGIDRIEDAEVLRNAEICVTENEAVELEDGEFFDWELSGCTVETVTGETVGTVKELLRTGGTEVLVIDGADKEYLIPFAESICTEVDVEKKKIVIDPPEGLLEF
jgi:16S rRNA processing protein RimM